MDQNNDVNVKLEKSNSQTQKYVVRQLTLEEGYQLGSNELAHGTFELKNGCKATEGLVGSDTAKWEATINQVARSTVSIHFCRPYPFDTESAVSSEATGFVVDAEKGYILTNRHVVGAGPFWGYCIFDNHEECDVLPVYRDPIHDFGILRFNLKDVKYMKVKALEMRPDLARVGVEIRVVGNDAAEKLSILSGVISRVDRNTPSYGKGYNDFNTNYIQASAAARGGSSGSPIINIDGYVVAIQAGGRIDSAATDYFLPLDRPLQALHHIQNGRTVLRGTLQTQWLLKPYDECRKLGLVSDWETKLRQAFPQDNNLLVAQVILPGGPAHHKIQEGDILLKINDELINQFVRLDDILDTNVGMDIELLLQRGSREVKVKVDVEDLHSITPDRFVEVAGGTFLDFSYQKARYYALAVKGHGVCVCESPISFRIEGITTGCVIHAIDNREISDLDSFVQVIKSIPDRARIEICYKELQSPHISHTGFVIIDRHWSGRMRMAIRNDKTGLWDFNDMDDPLPPEKRVSKRANFPQIPSLNYPKAVEIIKSFVKVTTFIPVNLDGFPFTRKIGHGLVTDSNKGLVVVSRAVVPHTACDVYITIANSIVIEGKVIFLHPLQNYAIVQYDSTLVNAPVQSAKLSAEAIKQGDETIFFGFNYNRRPVVVKTSVTDVNMVTIPANNSPRYRAMNIDATYVDTHVASRCRDGVLVNEDGTVQALWLTCLGEHSDDDTELEYYLGLASPLVLPIVDQVRNDIRPMLRILNVQLHTIDMSEARIMGIAEEWIERVERKDPARHQLLLVHKVDFGHNDNDSLQERDVILTLNNELITRTSDLDVQYNHEWLDAVIVRQREQISIKISTVSTDELETSRALLFCGATLQCPHHAVRQQISRFHSDVYISSRMRGSPAWNYGLSPSDFITEVNGISTPDLDTFLNEVKKIPNNTYFSIKVVTFNNIPSVKTMKKNEHYFPTTEFLKDEEDPLGWKKIVHEAEIEKSDG